MRIQVALTDWEQGHFWSYGNHLHQQWRAGDVTTFDWMNVPTLLQMQGITLSYISTNWNSHRSNRSF
jgi:hypothetical protein